MSVIESTKPGAFISLATAADMLGVSVHTLRRRIAAGELPAFRAGKRIIRIRVSDLERMFRRVPTADRGWR
jgi:excisionase family DNA binding protein